MNSLALLGFSIRPFPSFMTGLPTTIDSSFFEADNSWGNYNPWGSMSHTDVTIVATSHQHAGNWMFNADSFDFTLMQRSNDTTNGPGYYSSTASAALQHVHVDMYNDVWGTQMTHVVKDADTVQSGNYGSNVEALPPSLAMPHGAMQVATSGSWWNHTATHSETTNISLYGGWIRGSETNIQVEHDFGSNWQAGQGGGWSNHSDIQIEHHMTESPFNLNWYGVGAPALPSPVITLTHSDYHWV